jgi:hypothetical protein
VSKRTDCIESKNPVHEAPSAANRGSFQGGAFSTEPKIRINGEPRSPKDSYHEAASAVPLATRTPSRIQALHTAFWREI